MLDVYGTFPMARIDIDDTFPESIAKAARWSESAGLTGLLIFTDNETIDPWSGAQFLIERSRALTPLVAVQPLYMHPYTAARKVSTLASLYQRRVDLNLVAGSYRPHLRALAGDLPHQDRYQRMTEYAQVLLRLLSDGKPLTHQGRHYALDDAVLHPRQPPQLRPRVFVAGTSPAAAETARTLGATRLLYPQHPEGHNTGTDSLGGHGIRVGIIARDDSAAAWRIAHERFPRNEFNEIVEQFHSAQAANFDAHWHHDTFTRSSREHRPAGAYWLYPFRVTREYCPYLVGSHDEVATVLARYLRAEVRTLILAAPRSESDLRNAMEAVRRAEQITEREEAA